ncbi:MAG TPA: nucleoside-diphosphate kinase [Victivallales bacterium]|nr:nucleoside-diphosphate kinase [Victivallales bacterium]HPO91687.1 nucleoside-diphosphate kinase [Victivallales bacterium]
MTNTTCNLSYVVITPYTILKSRTGGVIARLLSRLELELIGAQMLHPDEELVKKYADLTYKSVASKNEQTAQLLKNYILEQLMPTEMGPRRIMFLLFKGENACEKLKAIVGKISAVGAKIKDTKITGETIRGTYADLVYDNDGNLKYFEPAVLSPQDDELLREKLQMFAEAASRGSNVLTVKYDDMENIERTLVLIKPDNWKYPSSKPGNIIDMFSRTGLRIIGCKIYQMSVSEALNFYGHVKDALRSKLSPKIGIQAREILERELKIKLDAKVQEKLSELIGIPYADEQFNQIIEFMSGKRPENCPVSEFNAPGMVKTMALIYEGKNAVKRIREVLGPTDPTKAPSGTIRKEFGKDVMVNTAHASDSVENAIREMGIIKIQYNPLANIIREQLKI